MGSALVRPGDDAITGGASIVGVGPILTEWHDGQHCYYVDLVRRDGGVSRLRWPKAGRAADRGAKLAAIRKRIQLAHELRPSGVVLMHDQYSFEGLVRLLAPHRADAPMLEAA